MMKSALWLSLVIKLNTFFLTWDVSFQNHWSEVCERLWSKSLKLKIFFDWIWSATTKTWSIYCCSLQHCFFFIIDHLNHILTHISTLMICIWKCDDQISEFLFNHYILHFSLVQYHRKNSKSYVLNELTTFKSNSIDIKLTAKVQN